MKACGITDIGKVRKENQDSFLIREYSGAVIGVVCDGMGGARSGNVASSLAADCFVSHLESCREAGDSLPDDELIREAVSYANVKTYDRAFTDFTCEGMGTTLVGGVFSDEHATIANIGDSRAYMISRGVIWQLTKDHSYVQELVEQGIITREAARTHPKRNYITRALGLAREAQCDIYSVDVEPGNVILLCTDGLSNMVTEDEMLSAAEELGDPAQLCEKLMQLALGREATDNITVAAFCF